MLGVVVLSVIAEHLDTNDLFRCAGTADSQMSLRGRFCGDRKAPSASYGGRHQGPWSSSSRSAQLAVGRAHLLHRNAGMLGEVIPITA